MIIATDEYGTESFLTSISHTDHPASTGSPLEAPNRSSFKRVLAHVEGSEGWWRLLFSDHPDTSRSKDGANRGGGGVEERRQDSLVFFSHKTRAIRNPRPTLDLTPKRKISSSVSHTWKPTPSLVFHASFLKFLMPKISLDGVHKKSLLKVASHEG